jgi:hypothetical protein
VRNFDNNTRTAFYLQNANNERAGHFFYDANFSTVDLRGNYRIYLDTYGGAVGGNVIYDGIKKIAVRHQIPNYTLDIYGDLRVAPNLKPSQGFVVTSTPRIGLDVTPTAILHLNESDAYTDTRAGILLEQVGTGDAQIQFLLTGQRRWVVGIDNSDSDKFKLASTSDRANGIIMVETSGNTNITQNLTTDKVTLNKVKFNTITFFSKKFNRFLIKPISFKIMDEFIK